MQNKKIFFRGQSFQFLLHAHDATRVNFLCNILCFNLIFDDDIYYDMINCYLRYAGVGVYCYFTEKTFCISEEVFDQVELLAKRTAEMHLALYAPEANEMFVPEHFDEDYRQFHQAQIELRSAHERQQHLVAKSIGNLEQQIAFSALPVRQQEIARQHLRFRKFESLGQARQRLPNDGAKISPILQGFAHHTIRKVSQ